METIIFEVLKEYGFKENDIHDLAVFGDSLIILDNDYNLLTTIIDGEIYYQR